MSITGKPYDTLEDTIGFEQNSLDNGSLKDWHITYSQVDLDVNGQIDIDKVLKN